jgi:hypothetical protein
MRKETGRNMSKLMIATSCCLALLGVTVLGQTTAPAQTAQPPVPAPQYLAEAARSLAGVSDESLRSDTKKNLVQLRKDFETLSANYKASPANAADWQPALWDVERGLVLLVGGGGPEPAVEAKPIPGLPAEVPESPARTALEEFRTYLELFFDAAISVRPQLPPSKDGVAF